MQMHFTCQHCQQHNYVIYTCALIKLQLVLAGEMKPSVCCVVLFLLFHCAAPKSLPSESETTTTAADEEITTVAEVNATVGEASTTLSSSTASASTVAPSPPAATPSSVVSSYSPMQNLIKNVGYAFRIVMKLLAPLFATPQNQKPADAVSEYEDFDEIPTDEDDEASRQAALANSFVRTVRQVAEQGRQGGEVLIYNKLAT